MKEGGCPFEAAAKQPKSSMCPMASRLQAASQTDEPGKAATCPLGFGSSRGPKLSTLHCPVCRGLLFDAHTVTSCKHTFCQTCITQTRDCPTCGRDVEGLEPNSELAGLVDTFMDTHSQSPELVAAQADLGPLPDNSPASFFMAQGLKSLSGGNVHAALHRLGRCRQALLQTAPSAAEAAAQAVTESQPQAGAPAAGAMDVDSHDQRFKQQHQKQQQQHGEAAEPVISQAVQLATVCGCLGDCYQRLGDAGLAEQLYKESIAAVQVYAEGNAEAAHAMSVSLNKLGDVRYLAQQLSAAKQLYKQALQLRQLCCGPLTSGQAGPEQQLELAASLIKVADVCKALSESDEADQLLRRAHGVCCEVKTTDADLPAAVGRKLMLLLDVLQAQAPGLGGGQGPAAAAAAAAAAD